MKEYWVYVARGNRAPKYTKVKAESINEAKERATKKDGRYLGFVCVTSFYTPPEGEALDA